MNDEDKEAIEWIKVDLKSLRLVEPIEARLIKQKNNLIPALERALLALEQKEKLSKWLDDVEGFETKEFSDTLEKTLFGKLVGTCKIREIMELKKGQVKP